ncbi:MAG TPA: tRNA pseudouridine(13) synthase TruD [Nitrososphaeraceae archaeon]|jgi:tRNA pseudouridine13 synthase|nr:tRNA pseudouridine(13) synthase TruD [Nitrososphaeraceae archaeon]
MNTQVPKIDKLAGIECYCTDYRGISGSIKRVNEEFRVSEVIDTSFLANISTVQDEHHKYPLYILEKRNIDSNHAIFEIRRKLGIKLKVIGLKDAKAVTKQYASSEQTKNIIKEAATPHTLLSLKGFTKTPIGKSSLSGNAFTITIHDPIISDISSFIPEIKNIANFYGLQRFGSERMVTHLVGKEIVKRNFQKAVELLLSFTTEYDTTMSIEIRNKSRDPKKYSQIIRELPKRMDIEYQVMSVLEKGKGPIAALRSVPINIRRLFVQAYQAYIFNKCLSIAVLNGENVVKSKEGDLCFEIENSSVFGRIRKYNPSTDLISQTVPAIRLIGYTFQPGKGRFDKITEEIMSNEGITPREFYIKEMQELSAQGGFRQAPLWSKDFTFRGSLTVCFKLPKGSYATTLLRELIKPDDPVRAGF